MRKRLIFFLSEKEWSGIQTVFSEPDFSQTLLLLNKHTNAAKQEHALAKTELCNHDNNSVYLTKK